VPFSRK